MDITRKIQEYIDEFEFLLKKFHKGSSGLFLSSTDEAFFKQKLFEITDILDNQFGQKNRYSTNIMHTANSQIGGFPPGPSYKCVQDIIGLLKAAEKYANIQTINKDTKKEENISINDQTQKLIFISHAEIDKELAEKLVDFLLSALELDPEEIRCTSLPGHQLSLGERISEHLKKDIRISAIIIALVTRSSLRSNWVVFELGASWALGKQIIPILSAGLKHIDLPGPLSEYSCILADASDASSRLLDAVDNISSVLKVTKRTASKPVSKLNDLLDSFHKWAPQPSPVAVLGAGTSGIKMLRLLYEIDIPVVGVYDKRPEAEGLNFAREKRFPLYYGSTEELLKLQSFCRSQPDSHFHFFLMSEQQGFVKFIEDNWQHLSNCVLLRLGKDFPMSFTKQDIYALFERCF